MSIIGPKRLVFLGDTRDAILGFPSAAKRKVGFERRRVQEGSRPADAKPLASVGAGVEEIRIWVESGTYRVIYVARRPEAVYVLHAFQKKTQATRESDLELARRRLASL